MLIFDKADLPVTLEDIRNKITDKQIFERYCLNFKEIDKDFLSEFYQDNRPSCRIYYNDIGKLSYHDFGNGFHCTCYGYIMFKYNCTFYEALNIIYNDFNLNKVTISTNVIQKNDIILNTKENYKKITIIPKPFTIEDYNYWSKYKIPLELLEEYNVFSCSYVLLNKNGKLITFETQRENPAYAYRFTYEGEYYYKIYKPLESNKRYKWLFDGNKHCIEGEDQLPHFGDLLILTKSLKDCICYNLLGYPAISLQGECNRLDYDTKNRLLKRFKTIIVNYDNDDEGIRGSKRLMQENGFKYFFIDDSKDLSDYMVNHTIEEAKLMIKNKING